MKEEMQIDNHCTFRKHAWLLGWIWPPKFGFTRMFCRSFEQNRYKMFAV